MQIKKISYQPLIFAFTGLLLIWSCTKDEDFAGSGVFFSDTIPSEIIHDVVFNSKDEMWILGSAFDPEADLPPWSSYLPFKMQLIKRSSNGFQVYDRIPNLNSIQFDKSDRLLGLQNKSIQIFKNEGFIAFKTPDLPENAGLNSMVIDDFNRIWVAGANAGISMFDGDEWKSYTRDNSVLSDNSIMFLATNGSSVWGLTEGQEEIFEILDGQMKLLSFEKDTALTQTFYFMEADPDGNLWFAGQNNIFVMSPRGFNVDRTVAERISSNLQEPFSIRKIKVDKKGNLFVLYITNNTTERKIIKVGKTGKIEDINIPTDAAGHHIYTMSFDSKNQLWIGTTRGVFKIEN